MIRLVVAALLVAAASGAEILLPGRPLYHSGWYNVALAALVVVAIASAPKASQTGVARRRRLAALALVLGTAAAGVATVASGLFAPDTRDYAGAPGQRVRVDELGTLVFPLTVSDASVQTNVTLERPLRAPAAIGERPRNAGNFILRTLPRDVVYVQAWDARGNQLTITQPSGAVFLSPVLLMQQRQTIAGLDVPFDSFNLPAARRVVKAILFTPAEAAVMLHGIAGQPAVLFAVDDANERPLPHAIALSAGGNSVTIGGVRLRATVASYPQVEVVAAPSVAAVALGVLLIFGGLAALISARST